MGDETVCGSWGELGSCLSGMATEVPPEIWAGLTLGRSALGSLFEKIKYSRLLIIIQGGMTFVSLLFCPIWNFHDDTSAITIGMFWPSVSTSGLASDLDTLPRVLPVSYYHDHWLRPKAEGLQSNHFTCPGSPPGFLLLSRVTA